VYQLVWTFTLVHKINLRKNSRECAVFLVTSSGADPGFQVRGGALKKIALGRGRRENFWGISCEKSRFYAKKKSYFYQF
jgi:hypothetical protein